ncbi:MAG: VOC family protein [Proteobacteria bacterium]|nr:VOC family protein [Pseudomonadota bacterium]
MIDHISLGVGDLEHSRKFYETALAPLGIVPIYNFDDATGYGRDGNPFLWIGRSTADGVMPEQGLHVALVASSHEAVHAFYEAAMAAGATDNGPPGPRPQYSPTYYASFVIDPDGHRLEAVCRAA